MVSLPYCSKPVVIFNRGAIRHIIANNGFYMFGKWVDCTAVKYLYATDFPFKSFNKSLNLFYTNSKNGADGLRLDRLESCYTLDTFGEKCYLYLGVPCNHCDLCQARRVAEFGSRIEMESAVSNTRPIMVTLTYDNNHLPFERYFYSNVEDMQHNIVPLGSWQVHGSIASSKFNSYFSVKPTSNSYTYHGSKSQQTFYFNDCFHHRPTLDITDVQKFLKRLRIFWTRHNTHPTFYDDGAVCESYADYTARFPFRYAIIGEYGKNGNRPHYHCVFWNLPYSLYNPITDIGSLEYFKRDLVKCWQNGKYDATQCEFAVDCGKYVGKYIGKDLGSGRKGTYQTSRLGGGLGSKYIDSLQLPPSYITIPLVSRNGQYKELAMGRYANNRLYPNLTRLIHNSVVQKNRLIVNVLSDTTSNLAKLGYKTPYSFLKNCVVSRHLPHFLGIPSSNPNKIRYSGDYRYVDTYPSPSMRVYEPTEVPDLTCSDQELLEDDVNLLFLQQDSILILSNLLSNKLPSDLVEIYGLNDKTMSRTDDDIQQQLTLNNKHRKYLELQPLITDFDTIRHKLVSTQIANKVQEQNLSL